MALDKRGLSKSIFDILDSGGEVSDVANGFARSYVNYAKNSAAGGHLIFPDSSILDAKMSPLALTIQQSLGTTGTPDKLPNALSFGLTIFWTSVPFGVPPVSGLSVPPTYVFVPILTKVLSNNKSKKEGGNTKKSVADAIAEQLDLATKSVLVTFVSPPPPAGPPPPALLT